MKFGLTDETYSLIKKVIEQNPKYLVQGQKEHIKVPLI